MYLLYTEVVSELCKVRFGKGNKNVVAWSEGVNVDHL